jgi:predicted small lipoprotein YifL
LRQRPYIVLILILAIVLITAGCGRKKPPFLPKKEIPIRVEHLEAVWENGVFHLKGTVVYPKGGKEKMPPVSGCRVYHAFYAQNSPPCEGCPIDFAMLREIEGTVVADKGFSCDVPMKKKNGIHFFKVCLTGQNGEKGPLSDRAKAIIVDD